MLRARFLHLKSHVSNAHGYTTLAHKIVCESLAAIIAQLKSDGRAVRRETVIKKEQSGPST